MKCLGIDTSGSHLTVAIINEDKTYSKHLPNCNLQHSVIAMQEVEDLLLLANLDIFDIDVFACVVGPGSFTGIRIGISMVKAFAFACGKKVLSLTSFDVLAYSSDSSKNLALIDAKHDNYYICGYENLKPITSGEFYGLEKVKEISKEYENLLISSTNEDFTSNCNLEKGFINALKNNLDKATSDRESLIALYLKKSQAEENK